MLNSAILLITVLILALSCAWLYRQNQRLLKMLQEAQDTTRLMLEVAAVQDEAIQRLRRRPIAINSRLYHAYRINPASIHKCLIAAVVRPYVIHSPIDAQPRRRRRKERPR